MSRQAAVFLTFAVATIAACCAAPTSSVAASSKRYAAAHPHAVDYHHHRHHHYLRRGDEAASAGDRHPAHSVVAHEKPFGAPIWEPPAIPTPYPYDGKLAGDGVLHTGWLDSNVLRAFGLVIY